MRVGMDLNVDIVDIDMAINVAIFSTIDDSVAHRMPCIKRRLNIAASPSFV